MRAYLRDVQQPRHAANVDECAVRLDCRDHALEHGADREAAIFREHTTSGVGERLNTFMTERLNALINELIS